MSEGGIEDEVGGRHVHRNNAAKIEDIEVNKRLIKSFRDINFLYFPIVYHFHLSLPAAHILMFDIQSISLNSLKQHRSTQNVVFSSFPEYKRAVWPVALCLWENIWGLWTSCSYEEQKPVLHDMKQ